MSTLKKLDFNFEGFKGIPKELLKSVQGSTTFPAISEEDLRNRRKPGESKAEAIKRIFEEDRQQGQDRTLPRTRTRKSPGTGEL